MENDQNSAVLKFNQNLDTDRAIHIISAFSAGFEAGNFAEIVINDEKIDFPKN